MRVEAGGFGCVRAGLSFSSRTVGVDFGDSSEVVGSDSFRTSEYIVVSISDSLI